ncbi:MAG: transposase, partial [Sciscionella sp.]
MRPVVWRPCVQPLVAEQAVISAVRRAKLFVFLREHRHELFDEEFQAELSAAYVDSAKGQPPVPPAQLALALILQAYTKVSDDEVIEATVMDRRWQLVLDCLGTDRAPFAKGTLVGFRTRLIEADLDWRLIERTVALAGQTKEFGARTLRAALDSSPLWGAGRVQGVLVDQALAHWCASRAMVCAYWWRRPSSSCSVSTTARVESRTAAVRQVAGVSPTNSVRWSAAVRPNVPTLLGTPWVARRSRNTRDRERVTRSRA